MFGGDQCRHKDEQGEKMEYRAEYATRHYGACDMGDGVNCDTPFYTAKIQRSPMNLPMQMDTDARDQTQSDPGSDLPPCIGGEQGVPEHEAEEG